MGLTVNKDEAARLLGVSPPTFDKWLKNCPDLPVVSGGSRGIPYAFDPDALVAWRKGTIERLTQEAEDRAAQLMQFEFPAGPGEDPGPSSPAARVQIARATKLERDMAREAGLLVPTAGVRQALQLALATLGRQLEQLPGQLAREFNLPDAVQSAMRRRIDDLRGATVRQISQDLTEGQEPDEQRRFA